MGKIFRYLIAHFEEGTLRTRAFKTSFYNSLKF